jgi:hypothetical protein
MTNFKGTKGKWVLRSGYRTDIISANDSGFGIVDFGTEQEAYLADYPIEQLKANALLISKAPEMLEMLSRVIETFTPTVNSPLEQSQEDLLNNIEQLIKEATDYEHIKNQCP